MKLNVNISGYEGPLDFLLDLSKKQKVDIKKISILELSEQYLNFINENLHHLKLSADYLVMASLLAFLKSRLLLPDDQSGDTEEIEQDISNRLIHYDAIKKLSRKIFDLPKEGENFFNIKIKNEFIISNKLVPKIALHDIIFRYTEIAKKKNTIKILSVDNDLYTIDDGFVWLDEIFKKIIGQKWTTLFDFLPKKFQNIKLKKSAIISLLLASLNRVKEGKIEINQKQHYDKILVKSKL